MWRYINNGICLSLFYSNNNPFDITKMNLLKETLDILKENGNCYVIDSRVGGEEYKLQSINLFNSEEIKEWEKSFDITPADLPCGAKSVGYTNLSVASEVCNIVKKINNGEKYPTRLIRNTLPHKNKYHDNV